MEKMISATKSLLITLLTWLVFLGLPANVQADAGNALEFDGVDDYVELDSNLTVGNTFTIEMWVNPSSTDDLQAFIGKHKENKENIFNIGFYSGGITVTLRDDSISEGTKFTGWHYLAAVVTENGTGSDVVLYIDGIIELQTETPLTSQMEGEQGEPQMPWVLGQDWDNFIPTPWLSDFFQGQIDEIRFWNTARTQAEIQDTMYRSLAGNETDLLAYYRFDQSAGTTLPDTTSNGLDGTLINMDDADWVISGLSINYYVAPTEAFNIWTTSAKIFGNVIDEGASPVSERGFCWNTSPLPTVADNPITVGLGSGLGEFSTVLSGLIHGTTYYVRAYATNNEGTRYGAQKIFTTIDNVHIVPDNYSTIQSAIDTALSGDGVLIKDGTYTGADNKNLDFNGKAITVRSENGPEYTIIDCEYDGRAFYFHTSESRDSIIEGLQIINGFFNTSAGGGAIYIDDASPVIYGCIFKDNEVRPGYGGAIFIGGVNGSLSIRPLIINCKFLNNLAQRGGAIALYSTLSPEIVDCTFENNSASLNGGAIIGIQTGKLDISGCQFINNSAFDGREKVSSTFDGSGGAIYYSCSEPLWLVNSFFYNNIALGENEIGGETYVGSGGSVFLGGTTSDGSPDIITNCTFTDNTSYYGGALAVARKAMVINSILWGNNAARGHQLYVPTGGEVTLTHIDIEGGLTDIYRQGVINNPTGIIAENPLMRTPGQPEVQGESPCIDAGASHALGGIPALDIWGNLRSVDGDNDGTFRPDIGAFEYTGSSFWSAPSEVNFSYKPGVKPPAVQKVSLLCSGSCSDTSWYARRYSYNLDWLIVTPDAGTFGNETNLIKIGVNHEVLEQMTPGEYLGTVELTDDSGTVVYQTIPVLLTVNKTLRVPDDYATIQVAIDAAIDGDTVLVANGTYTGAGNMDIDFRGKKIVVRSENGPDFTTIDCDTDGIGSGDGRGFIFQRNETALSVLQGFKIINGFADDGGAIYIGALSSPTILNCQFISNEATHYGGAIYTQSSGNLIIRNSLFDDNTAVRGAALCLGRPTTIVPGTSNCVIDNCLFTKNDVADLGGAIWNERSGVIVQHSSFLSNTAESSGGAICLAGGEDMKVNSCYFISNVAEKGAAIHAFSFSNLHITNSLFESNINTNPTGFGVGFGVIHSSGNMDLSNCTFANNDSIYLEVHDYWDLIQIKIFNTIIYNSDSAVAPILGYGNSCKGALFQSIRHTGIPNCSTAGINNDVQPIEYADIYFTENNYQLVPAFDDNDEYFIDKGSFINGIYSDYRGSLRPVDGNGDGTAEIDIGAMEYSGYFGGTEGDVPTHPFKELRLDAAKTVVTDQPYVIKWKDRDPFPENDPRISQSGEYVVNIALVNEFGYRIDLVNNELVQISLTGYTIPFIFSQEHIGTWQLRLELVEDPNQYVLSEQINIEYKETTTYYLGQEIQPPSGAFPGQKPDFDDEEACYWSVTSNKLYATAARFVIITWYEDEHRTLAIPVVASIRFPDSGYTTHVADTPPVNLMQEDTVFDLVQIKYANNDARLTNNSFTASLEGWALLYFIDNETGDEVFETVLTVAWNNSGVVEDMVVDFTLLDPIAVNIGTELTGTPTELYVNPEPTDLIHDASCGNGFVYFENSPYDGYGENKAYDRATRVGQIFPVNKNLSGPVVDPIDDLVVIWYLRSTSTEICWPGLSARYAPVCPDSADKIIIASQDGTGPLGPETYGSLENMLIYNQPDSELPGFNPNEEHSMFFTARGSSYPAVYALRNDLNSGDTSDPYVLLKYRDPFSDAWKMKVWEVVAKDGSSMFSYNATAGEEISPPYPLNQMLFGPCPESSVQPADENYVLEDKDDKIFAKQGGVSVGTTFFYKLQEGFHFDLDLDGVQDELPGACISWLDGVEEPGIWDPSTWDGIPQVATYTIGWPESVPTLHVGETLVTAKAGLPEIGAQCKVDILYEDPPTDLVRLFDPLWEGGVSHILANPEIGLPAGLKPEYDLGSGRWVFTALPYHIQIRLTYDAVAEELKLKGLYSEGTGEPTLLLNQLTFRELESIDELLVNENVDDPDSQFWGDLNALNVANISKNNDTSSSLHLAEFKALSAGDAQGTGYVTLGFNNHEDCPAPTMLSVIQVGCPLYTGEIDVFESSNPFDEKLTLRHNGDFGGNSDGKAFHWRYMKTTDVTGTPEANDPNWNTYTSFEPVATPHPTETGFYQQAVDAMISGSGDQLLTDKWFSVRYYDPNAEGICSSSYSPWTPAQLYEGWIKRVMKKINLFDQKVKDFHASDVNTQASMISLAGEQFEGDIALSDDPEYLQNIGMIEVYETLLKRGETFMDGTSAVNQTVMFAANRLADLYMLLGNEAYGDGADPTIGFSTESGVYGTEAPSIFCFQNQVDTLLDEELALLQGRDSEGVRPFYNRLVWNFTLGDGEVAYKENYNITDQLTEDSDGDTYPDAQDGEINEWDAKIQFPQGHGDAWGYYLSATKRYYRLLRNDNFTWVPQAEAILVAETPVEVDYRDERKFAIAAAAKAKTGSEIVNLTYNKMYTEDPEGQWLGYKDTNEARAWGVDSWARRAGQGALFDWAVGNAILPESSENEGIQKVDRTTVMELAAIAAEYRTIESQVDTADAGLNPLGLAKGIVPFDIDPAAVSNGETHFEQIYNRAVQATNNAIAVFNHANESSQLLRRQQDSLADFKRNIENSEDDYNNRLIEIFGYPYGDDCGPGKTYPTDYCQTGPDLYHYMYVDASELMGEENVQVHQFSVTMKNFEVNTDPQEVIFHIDTDSRFGLIKPGEWYGRRKAQGAIQVARSELLQTRGRFEKALIDYDNLLFQIEDQADILQEQYGINTEEIVILYVSAGLQVGFNASIAVSRLAQYRFSSLGSLAVLAADAAQEALPTAVGTTVDATAPARSALKFNGAAFREIFGIMSNIASLAELGFSQAKELVSAESNILLTTLHGEFAAYQQLKQLESTMRSEASVRHDLYVMAETLRQSAERYRSTLAQAVRLIADRTDFRIQTAAQIQDYRYKDMAFRIFRNDSLQKYRAQFDMAARYVYLAAKAYDYETTLLDYETMAGEQFLTDIVKQRAIGRIENGQPLTGTGLADPMRRMWQNFQVLKPQLGFNNPQIETNRFSLRQELFRIKMDMGSNVTWKQVLDKHIVDNIWDVREFRRYCRPFAEEGLSEPGIVIPFSTTINAGLNFFHWPLGGGDSYYSASNFATKVRGVGVWFSNYIGSGLAQTPRVYLIPVGEDILRTPSYHTREIRTWQVVDQKLPTPFPIVPTEMQGDPDWIPLVDTIFDDMFEIRRHSDFRAYHDSGYLNESEMQYDTRLIGRSVWNNKWLLIIPGRNLLYDGEEGLQTFIDGPELFGGLPGERTGNGISDIKLFFSTYSYSGN